MTDNSPQQPAPLVPAGLRSKGFWLSLFFSVVLIAYYVAYIVGGERVPPRARVIQSAAVFPALLPFLRGALASARLGPEAVRSYGV